MKVLVVGSAGLLGQAVSSEVRSRHWSMVTAGRSGADRALDIGDAGALDDCLEEFRPELLFNCAALTDFSQCEHDPGLAYRVNARPLAIMAAWSQRTGGRLIHVSTDQYFVTGGARPHREDE